LPATLCAGQPDAVPVVKQSAQCEIFFVRENTPITIHLSKKSDNVSTFSICTEELLPGGVIPAHKHINEDEYFYFISGTGIIIADEKESSFKPGTSAFVRKNTWHTIKNTGIRSFSNLDILRRGLKTFSAKLEHQKDSDLSKDRKK